MSDKVGLGGQNVGAGVAVDNGRQGVHSKVPGVTVDNGMQGGQNIGAGVAIGSVTQGGHSKGAGVVVGRVREGGRNKVAGVTACNGWSVRCNLVVANGNGACAAQNTGDSTVVGTDSSQQDGTNRGVGAWLSNDGQARRYVGVGVVGCNDSVDQGERNIVLTVLGRGWKGGWKEGAGVVEINGYCGQGAQITGSSAVKVGRGNGGCVEKRCQWCSF